MIIDLTCSTNFTKLFIKNGDIGKIQYELQFHGTWMHLDLLEIITNTTHE